MTNETANKLNQSPIQWCSYRVLHDNPLLTSKQKMFAWIMCFILENDKAGHFVNSYGYLQFRVDLSEYDSNDAIKNFLYKKRYWTFIKSILKEHIDNTIGIENQVYEKLIDHSKIYFLGTILVVRYKI